MKQNELNRQVALVTGESIDCIRHRGFGPLDVHSQSVDSELDGQPNWVDWDELDAERCR